MVISLVRCNFAILLLWLSMRYFLLLFCLYSCSYILLFFTKVNLKETQKTALKQATRDGNAEIEQKRKDNRLKKLQLLQLQQLASVPMAMSFAPPSVPPSAPPAPSAPSMFSSPSSSSSSSSSSSVHNFATFAFHHKGMLLSLFIVLPILIVFLSRYSTYPHQEVGVFRCL